MQLFKSDAEKREEGLVMRLVFFLASVQALSCQRFPPHSSVSGHTREGLDRG